MKFKLIKEVFPLQTWECRKCHRRIKLNALATDVLKEHVCKSKPVSSAPVTETCPVLECQHAAHVGQCQVGFGSHYCPCKGVEPKQVHPEPEGEDSGGAYHMMTIAEATKELIGVTERERMSAKPTAWYSLAIKNLIQRIVNLRSELAKAKAPATETAPQGKCVQHCGHGSEYKSIDRCMFLTDGIACGHVCEFAPQATTDAVMRAAKRIAKTFTAHLSSPTQIEAVERQIIPGFVSIITEELERQ